MKGEMDPPHEQCVPGFPHSVTSSEIEGISYDLGWSQAVRQ